MKKIVSLLITVLVISNIFTGCSKKVSNQKSEEEMKAEIRAELKAELKKEQKAREEVKTEEKIEVKTEDTKTKEEEKNLEKSIKEESIKGKIIPKEELVPMDFDLLYCMDSDLDFLVMKGMGIPSGDEAYYVDPSDEDGVETRYYLADDQYTINRVTLIGDGNTGDEDGVEYGDQGTGSFMGLYLGMPMELAKEYVQKESPDYDGELEVKYSDREGDGIVHQIDVFSKRTLQKRVENEDFYFKFFGMNMQNEKGHMGNNTGGTEELEVNEGNRSYTYTITFGPDQYQKIYICDEQNSIESIEIASDQDEFLTVVPSLFGITLGSEKDTIIQMIENVDKTVYSSNVSNTKNNNYDIMEYTIIDPYKIVYTAEVYIDRTSNKVKRIKGYLKSKNIVKLDDMRSLIGTELKGENQQTEGSGTEQWLVSYEAYDYTDNKIQSLAIYPTEESTYIDTVPSLCGLELNMFTMGVYNQLLNNGYEMIDEEAYKPFEDESLETIHYTVIDPDTKEELNIYITSRYIGDISAAIVVRISIS